MSVAGLMMKLRLLGVFWVSLYLGIRRIKQPLWDFQSLRPEVTVVAIGQLIVNCGHLGSNPDKRKQD